MNNIGWGLYMTLAGMGTVFLLLILLMFALIGVGRLDRLSSKSDSTNQPKTESAPPSQTTPSTEPAPGDGLTPELIAAITIAVITHEKVRRNEAAPQMRRALPGSQLYANRWVAVGRAYQNQPWK